MRDQPKHVRSVEDRRIEQLIVVQILRNDHAERWSRAELETELNGVAPLAISDALARLDGERVVRLVGEVVSASRAARRLDDLGLIAI